MQLKRKPRHPAIHVMSAAEHKGNQFMNFLPTGSSGRRGRAARGVCGPVLHQPDRHQPPQPTGPACPAGTARCHSTKPCGRALALAWCFTGRHCEVLTAASCPPRCYALPCTRDPSQRQDTPCQMGKHMGTWRLTRPLIKLYSSCVLRDTSQSKNINAQRTAPLVQP